MSINLATRIAVFNLFGILDCASRLRKKKNKTPDEEKAYEGYRKRMRFAIGVGMFLLIASIIGVCVFISFFTDHDQYSGLVSSTGHVYEDEDGSLNIWYIRNDRHDASIESCGLTAEDVSAGDEVVMYVEEDGTVVKVKTPAESDKSTMFSIAGLLLIVLALIVAIVAAIFHSRSPKNSLEKVWDRYYEWYESIPPWIRAKGELPDWHDETTFYVHDPRLAAGNDKNNDFV